MTDWDAFATRIANERNRNLQRLGFDDIKTDKRHGPTEINQIAAIARLNEGDSIRVVDAVTDFIERIEAPWKNPVWDAMDYERAWEMKICDPEECEDWRRVHA